MDTVILVFNPNQQQGKGPGIQGLVHAVREKQRCQEPFRGA